VVTTVRGTRRARSSPRRPPGKSASSRYAGEMTSTSLPSRNDRL
jgi:hypothetical protein